MATNRYRLVGDLVHWFGGIHLELTPCEARVIFTVGGYMCVIRFRIWTMRHCNTSGNKRIEIREKLLIGQNMRSARVKRQRSSMNWPQIKKAYQSCLRYIRK